MMGLRCFEKYDFIVLFLYASYGIRSMPITIIGVILPHLIQIV